MAGFSHDTEGVRVARVLAPMVAAAALIVAFGTAHAHAQGATVDIEVRVAAQRLADGRTEFALQHREPGGRWSDRVLPRARFFPATTEVGRWLVSTSVTVRAPGASADDDRAEVRVTARRLESGRVEFALRHREPGAEWSGRVLPRARFFPASPRVGRWLVSSPLSVAVPAIVGADFVGSPESDRAALVALFEATNGKHWRTSTSWLTDAPLGEWYGVTTDTSGRVAWLFLGLNELSGPIPPELGRLTSLTKLELSANALHGPIPRELGGLVWLRELGLIENQLSGPIPPELGNLTSLTLLHLSHNVLDGPIPPELGNLIALKDLFLSANRLSGPIPPELGGLVSLERLWLGGNELTGPIPRELGNLASLTNLSLNGNALEGSIPPELGRLASLRRLSLNENRLSGSVPAELGGLGALELLSLEGNELGGTIPPELGALASLAVLGLSRNQLSGPIPPELGELTALQHLRLNDNHLSGPIPVELGALSSLTLLQLAGNADLSGCVPRALWVSLYDILRLGLPFCE